MDGIALLNSCNINKNHNNILYMLVHSSVLECVIQKAWFTVIPSTIILLLLTNSCCTLEAIKRGML